MPESKSYKQYKSNQARDAWVKKHRTYQKKLRDTRDKEILKGLEEKSSIFKKNRNIPLRVEFTPGTYFGFKQDKAHLFSDEKLLCELNEAEVGYFYNYGFTINGTDEQIWAFINGKKIIEGLCNNQKYTGDLSFKHAGRDNKHTKIYRNGKKLFPLGRRQIRWLKGSVYKLED